MPTRDGLVLSLAGIAETLAISIPTLLDAARGRLTREACDARLARWSETLLRQAGVQLEVTGEPPRAGERAFMVMSNHRSLYDVPVLFASFPGPLRMVAKSELFRVPVWGPAMRAAEFIAVDRAGGPGALDDLRRAKGVIERGVSVWIAPEGTRSRDGSLGPFKSGGFRLALELACPILPVAIAGTEQIFPAKGARVRRGARVQVHYGAPVDTDVFGDSRKAELVAEVRGQIAAALGGLEQKRAR